MIDNRTKGNQDVNYLKLGMWKEDVGNISEGTGKQLFFLRPCYATAATTRDLYLKLPACSYVISLSSMWMWKGLDVVENEGGGDTLFAF